MKTNEWIVAGNWKMNLHRDQAMELIDGVIAGLNEIPNGVDLVLAPPFPYLDLAIHKSMGSDLLIAAQNCHHEKEGAFTGEVSTGMLSSIGVNACIIGHSERRRFSGETDEIVAQKVDAALGDGILPIFCCGEPLEHREAGSHFDYVKDQVQKGLFHLEPERVANVVVAYEPIWAIGTGLTATPQQAQEMHANIRSVFLEKYGDDVAREIRIIYGGSCKPENAKELFACPDVNGGLIGGASLNAESFLQIAHSVETV